MAMATTKRIMTTTSTLGTTTMTKRITSTKTMPKTVTMAQRIARITRTTGTTTTIMVKRKVRKMWRARTVLIVTMTMLIYIPNSKIYTVYNKISKIQVSGN